MAALSKVARIRIAWPLHPRHNEIAEALASPVNGRRLARFSDGVVTVLECHEWEAV